MLLKTKRPNISQLDQSFLSVNMHTLKQQLVIVTIPKTPINKLFNLIQSVPAVTQDT